MSCFEFRNVNPKGAYAKDCVKRAITTAANMDYHQVALELNRFRKITGACKFNSGDNPVRYVQEVLGAKRLSFPATKGSPRMTGIMFSCSHPTGSYILRMAGHWSACVNGKIIDTWDCSEKCVYLAWEIPIPNPTHKGKTTPIPTAPRTVKQLLNYTKTSTRR